MGCDIHMYPEYRKKPPKVAVVDLDNAWEYRWNDLMSRTNPGRNYRLFGHIAGVRHEVVPVVEPRGVPDDMAWQAMGDLWLRIHTQADRGAEPEPGPNVKSQADFDALKKAVKLCEEAGLELPAKILNSRYIAVEAVTPDVARGWVTAGYSTYRFHEVGEGVPTHVSQPDYHTHTWLTPAELKLAMARAQVSLKSEYGAVLAAMEHMQKSGFEVRVVIWFDN